MRNLSPLLFDEPPLIVSPTLAKILGLDAAIFIQQLHYWLNQRGGKVVDGVHWIYNTREQWLEQFPFWSESTLRRITASLQARNLIITANLNDLAMDKTLWYTIDYNQLHDVLGGASQKKEKTVDSDTRCVQNEQIEVFKMNSRSVQNEQSNTRDYPQRLQPETNLSPYNPSHSSTDQTPSPREGEERGRNGKSSQAATQSHQPSRKITNAYVTALGKVFHAGKTPEQLTDPAWEELRNVAKQLERTGDAPEEIAIRAARWNTHYPNAGAITKNALLKHWDTLANDPPPKPADRNDRSRWEMNGCVYAREEEDGSRSWPPGYRPSQADINMGKIIGKDGKMKSVWVG